MTNIKYSHTHIFNTWTFEPYYSYHNCYWIEPINFIQYLCTHKKQQQKQTSVSRASTWWTHQAHRLSWMIPKYIKLRCIILYLCRDIRNNWKGSKDQNHVKGYPMWRDYLHSLTMYVYFFLEMWSDQWPLVGYNSHMLNIQIWNMTIIGISTITIGIWA